MKTIQGFTLVELMITLAVVAILVTVGVPSYTDFIKNNRLTANANMFLTSIMLARSEAAKRGEQVTMCRSGNRDTCGNGDGWEDGWIVFVDSNDDEVHDTGEEVLRVQQRLGDTLTLRVPTSGNFDTALAFLSTGLVKGVAGGTLRLCDDRGSVDTARAIVVSATGSARISKTPSDIGACV